MWTCPIGKSRDLLLQNYTIDLSDESAFPISDLDIIDWTILAISRSLQEWPAPVPEPCRLRDRSQRQCGQANE